MPTLQHLTTKSPASDTITVDAREASRLAGVSAKTLERCSLAGEATGRAKIGGRVVYVRAALEKWINSKLTNTAAS